MSGRWYHVGGTRTNCRVTAAKWARSGDSAIVRVLDADGALVDSWILIRGKWQRINNSEPLAKGRNDMKPNERRSISVRGEFYAYLRTAARDRGMSIARLITEVVNLATKQDPAAIPISSKHQTQLVKRCRLTGESIGQALSCEINALLDSLEAPTGPESVTSDDASPSKHTRDLPGDSTWDACAG